MAKMTETVFSQWLNEELPKTLETQREHDPITENIEGDSIYESIFGVRKK